MSGPLPLQIWSHPFCERFDKLPQNIQFTIQWKVDEMARRLSTFSHERLQGRPEFRLRAGDYRVLYAFDLNKGQDFPPDSWAPSRHLQIVNSNTDADIEEFLERFENVDASRFKPSPEHAETRLTAA